MRTQLEDIRVPAHPPSSISNIEYYDNDTRRSRMWCFENQIIVTNPSWIGSVRCVKVECCNPRIFPTLTKGVVWQIVTNLSHSENWKQLTVDSTPPTILRLPSSPQRQLEQTTPAASWEVQSCTWDNALLVIMRTKMVMTQCKIEFTYASHCVSKNVTPRRMLKKCLTCYRQKLTVWPENLFWPKKKRKTPKSHGQLFG